MPLPLIPVILIGTGVVTGAGGAVLGLKGGYEIKRANSRIRAAGALYEAERAALETYAATTNDTLKSLGAHQEEAYRVVVERMADFLRRHEKLVSESEKLLVDGLDATAGRVSLDKSLGQDAVAWMRGIAGSAVTGVGISAGLTSAVTTFASASTGTAISTLSGAAATNATLAFLGGGSLATGGGGMVVGAAALNFVTIGPAILVSGFVVAGQGEKAKTKALENEAAVNIAIAEARDGVLGFTIGNDTTVENVEHRDHHLARSKCPDNFCAVGPWIDTEFDASDCVIEAVQNGEVIRRGRSSEQFWQWPQIVSWLSTWMTLEPWDLVLTGNPPDTVGMRFLGNGDTYTARVSGLGELTNLFVLSRPA